MKKLLILITFLSSRIYAQNCRSVDAEDKSNLQDIFWDNMHITILIQNGLICEGKGMFLNGYEPIYNFNICVSFNLNKLTGSVLIDKNKYKLISYAQYDEFLIPIKQTEPVKTKMSCIDLYKQFKKEMR